MIKVIFADLLPFSFDRAMFLINHTHVAFVVVVTVQQVFGVIIEGNIVTLGFCLVVKLEGDGKITSGKV